MRDMWLLLVLLPATILVLRNRKYYTEHVVALPITISRFSQVFLVAGRSQFTYAELESTLAWKGVIHVYL